MNIRGTKLKPFSPLAVFFVLACGTFNDHPQVEQPEPRDEILRRQGADANGGTTTNGQPENTTDSIPAIPTASTTPDATSVATVDPQVSSPPPGASTTPVASPSATPTPAPSCNVNFKNPVNRFDVNNDGLVSAIDALIITNEINRNGAHAVPNAQTPCAPPYIDVNGDGFVNSTDSQQVSDYLANPSPTP